MNDEAHGIFADRVFLLTLQQVQSLFNLNQSQFALMLLATANIQSAVQVILGLNKKAKKRLRLS